MHNSLPFWNADFVGSIQKMFHCVTFLKQAIVLSASSFKELQSAETSNTSRNDEVSIAEPSRMPLWFPLTTGKLFSFHA